MITECDSARPVDPGLEALLTLLHLLGIAADAGQVRHRLSDAIAQYEAALRLNPDFVPGWHNL